MGQRDRGWLNLPGSVFSVLLWSPLLLSPRNPSSHTYLSFPLSVCWFSGVPEYPEVDSIMAEPKVETRTSMDWQKRYLALETQLVRFRLQASKIRELLSDKVSSGEQGAACPHCRGPCQRGPALESESWGG